MTGPFIFAPDYYDRIRALERTGWWNAGMRDIAASFLSMIDVPVDGTVLDAGCGSGQTASWLQMIYPGRRLLGIDVSEYAVAAARTLPGIHVVSATVLEIPLRSESVDLVVTQDVLQHLPLDGGDGRALGEIARVLKRGGWLFLRTNSQAFPRTADDAAASFHKYRLDELGEKIERAGLRVARAGRVNAVLGLAEIPRELRAARDTGTYHGLLATPRETQPWWAPLARRILRAEGALARAGWPLPWGRSIVAICQRPT